MNSQHSNGPCQDHLTRKLGHQVRICHINIESISYAKSQYLSKLLLDNDIDLVAIQETHVNDDEQLRKRGKIPGYELLGTINNQAYGIATYVGSTVENACLISKSEHHNVAHVVSKIGGLTITNTYKPPATQWPTNVIQTQPHPAVYVGDYNSHHELWKYKANDKNGETLVDWMENEHLNLIFDAKQPGTFRSAAWKKDYNPDLCFVSSDDRGLPLAATRRVLPDFPHSQHRPVIIEVGTQIPLVSSLARPRWNFKKAEWTSFSENLDKCLGWVPATASNYKRLIGAMISSAKKCIPRGYREEYIPGWTQESDNLYQEFLESGDQDIADELLHSLDSARQIKWRETVESMNFQTSSREAWSLLRKLGGGVSAKRQVNSVSPNSVATNIWQTSKAPRDKLHTTRIKKELSNLKAAVTTKETLQPFDGEEVSEALKDLKPGKAPGFDGIHPEFLIHSGKYTRQWLAQFFSDIMKTGQVPYALKRSKIIAILKPGKPPKDPKNYRPIALLSMIYKLLERLLYNRISPRILEKIPIEQAGFRPGRSCVDQVLSLTTFIEAGFQKGLKTSAAFIDLSAEYDTVWREGLIFKLFQAIPSLHLITLINNMLNNRSFQVVMGDQTSSHRKLNNGLPQGSVLAPLLFSLYIADMPHTQTRKFGYADDWVIATQTVSLEDAGRILTVDLDLLGRYFRKWRLQPNAAKTEVSSFHLNNALSNKKLEVAFEGNLLNHNVTPKYLGVTLDRTLSFNSHLTKTAEKIKVRNNIIQKLCGSTWGSSASTLRISAIGLVFSAAEYCSPVWLNSSHTKKVDVQLNNTMRMISGAIRSTPAQWLPVLSHIPPPHLRRLHHLSREYQKIQVNRNLPIHQDITDANGRRLRSRKPPLKTAENVIEANFNITHTWKDEWSQFTPGQGMPCITEEPPGFDLPRKTWSTLNRIRTNHGRCGHMLHKWGKRPTPACDCGEDEQTITHITQECSLRSYEGNPSDFLHATSESIDYIQKLDVCL